MLKIFKVPLVLEPPRFEYSLYICNPRSQDFLEVVQNGLRKGDGKVKKDLAIKKNLYLLNEFMKYAFDNPDVLEKIPPEAELVILPIDDQELCEYNRKMANKMFSQGKKIVIVKMKKPELPVPEVELMMTATG